MGKETFLCLLSNLCGGGYADWEEWVRLMQEWSIDGSDVADRVKNNNVKNINGMYTALFEIHADDVQDIIVDDLLDELENSEYVVVDVDMVDAYKVDIAENYMATMYDDIYNFWEADNKTELTTNYKKDLIDFLIDEGIVELDAPCVEPEDAVELLRTALDRFLDTEDYTVFDAVVKKYIEKKECK